MHEPRSMRSPARAYGEELPAWIHGDSPYVEILEHAHGETLEEILPADDIPATLHALRALALPSDYATAGEDYVTHAPLPFVAATRDAGALERSNYACALELLEELEPADRVDVLPSRTRHWAVGYVDTVSVRPFVRGDDGRWSVTDAWREALEIGEALADYPVLDEEHWSALELEELEEYVASEIGDGVGGAWTSAVLEGILPRTSSVDDVGGSELEELASLAYADRVEPILERYRAWSRLRLVGDGQLTIYGETVRVPAPPSVEELEELLEDRLPWGIARVVEGSDTYADLLEALEDLERVRLEGMHARTLESSRRAHATA